MLNNENIICISSIDWDFVWQGHQEIMSTFARNGNRVLFIENTGVRKPTFKDVNRLKKRIINWFKSVKGFKKETENLFVYSPVVLPFPYSKLASWINKRLMIDPLTRWMKAVSFHNPIIWTFLPTKIALDIIDGVDGRKLLVYDAVANFDALTDNPKKLKETEEALIRKCDVIFAQGKSIADRCRTLNPNVHIFPPGVNAKVFEDFMGAPRKSRPDDIKGIKNPIIGYVGGIHKHIDMPLVSYMAKNHPEWSIVLVGPKQADTAELDEIPNIFALGKKDFSKLPAYIDLFDVCTIPYVISDYTKTVYPTKLNEYYIMGKPVVSTALPEVIAMNAERNITAIANSHKEFVLLVEKALASHDEKTVRTRMDTAKNNNWSERIIQMSAIMEKTIDRKKKETAPNWQEKFLSLYKNARHTAIKAITVAFAAYLLLFYTPIVWILARPLAIYNEPHKADAIVVLGGGVGESGKAGQGYEERAEYAIELYNKGYAGHIIFSSGFTNIFEETLVMKALAISSGVPESAIILENRASNTYDSVMFTKEILDKKRWNKIILLSSPYHMLRVSKVFSKVDGGIDVSYAPIPKSSFYAHNARGIFDIKISLKQINGILHEYLGVLYYWWKGWI